MSYAQILAGRKDWDVIAYDDYQNDMDDLATRSIEVIYQQREEIAKLKRTICAIVEAAGGAVSVPRWYIENERPITLEQEYSPYDMTYNFRTKRT